jgi:CubicO group peptidase (beta-lactamase class C family)
VASDDELTAELGRYLDRLAASDVFSGAVLVAREGTPIFTRAYGLASKSFNVPNRLDTKFNLGSMNKMFTAVCIAQLEQRGLLRFDDPIGRFLPDYPGEARNKVTVHHLLTHTSGLGDFFNQRFEATRSSLRAVRDFLPLFVEDPLQFEPGSRWQYSNGGFMVLGAIVEAVSGQDYFEYVRRQVYEPACMSNTYAYEMDRPTPNLAIGYTHGNLAGPPDWKGWRNNLFMHSVKGGPAGGGFSTVEDLLAFDLALREYRLLDAQRTETIQQGKEPTSFGLDERYGYGFSDELVTGARITGHGGGFLGINGQLDMYRDRGYTVAVLANYDPPAAQRVASWLRTVLTAR